MPGNRIVLFVATALALVGSASAVAVGSPKPSTSLSSGTSAKTSPRLDLPDVEADVPTTVAVDTTTTTTTAAAVVTTVPTTAKPTPTSTVTPTSVIPVATTVAPPSTTVPSDRAVISVVNTTEYEVKISVEDDEAKWWTLAPGGGAGPVSLKTSTVHGDSASVTRTDGPCGNGDGWDYFIGGHTYRLEAVNSPNWCGDGADGPRLLVHDLTAGTTKQI